MSPILLRSFAFAIGVVAVLLWPAVPHIVSPAPGRTRMSAVLAGLMVSGAMALPAFIGSWAALSRIDKPLRIPALAMVVAGVVLAVSIEPALRSMNALGIVIPIPRPFGIMLFVALLAAMLSLAAAAVARRMARSA